MKKCENCNIEHDGSYGSGRFCSTKCARGFSTKLKRKEINLKVSKALKQDSVMKKCESCNKEFEVPYKKRNRRFCSLSCSSKFAGKVKKPGNGGPRDGGGKSKVVEYVSPIAGKMKLNSDEIRVASVFDKLKIEWRRNSSIGFSYIDLDNNQRKFYPDFYIKEYDIYIEYKGWIDKKVSHKMNDALKRNNFNLLIIYSTDKRYKDLGLNIEQLENNNNLLIEFIYNSI